MNADKIFKFIKILCSVLFVFCGVYLLFSGFITFDMPFIIQSMPIFLILIGISIAFSLFDFYKNEEEK